MLSGGQKLTAHIEFPDKLDLTPALSDAALRARLPARYDLHGVLVHHCFFRLSIASLISLTSGLGLPLLGPSSMTLGIISCVEHSILLLSLLRWGLVCRYEKRTRAFLSLPSVTLARGFLFASDISVSFVAVEISPDPQGTRGYANPVNRIFRFWVWPQIVHSSQSRSSPW